VDARFRNLTRRISQDWVYTARSGLWTGLKRRGGFDFLPFRKLDKDAAFLGTLDFRNKVIYDIGGFVGLFSMFFARAVVAGQVITFEPVPKHRELILEHLALNHMKNVQLYHYGLGASYQTTTLLVCEGMGAYSTAHPEQKQLLESKNNCQEIPLEIAPLDDLIPKQSLPIPNFIKIDVEGLEFAALQGMEQTIKQHQPELFIELHGYDNAQIALWLLARGYRIWQVRDGLEITEANSEMAKRFLYAFLPKDQHKLAGNAPFQYPTSKQS
jgi:FkbM family methyltransferase